MQVQTDTEKYAKNVKSITLFFQLKLSFRYDYRLKTFIIINLSFFVYHLIGKIHHCLIFECDSGNVLGIL